MTEAEIKIKARSAVFIALQAGRMQKQPCAKCGATEKVEAHHEDYSKPLEVVWYCKEHHRQRHNEIECRDALPTECVEMALVWKCRLCDYRWMVEDLGYPPVRCANRHCRSTAWYRPKMKSGRPKTIKAKRQSI